MRTPKALETLVEYGIVEEVLRPLMSGKEAHVYLVRSGGELRVAKIYKDAEQRSFKQRSEYTEGRTTRNTRDRRAMAKHTRHGRRQDEAAWRSAEVDAIYRLMAAGVRVPVPYHFIDGVLIMELVRDHEGQPASRLGDLVYAPEVARRIFDILLESVVKMLCAGIVHGDLSEFNVLMAADGPVIIDFPQAVDPASNASARKLLIRDVDNLLRFLGRHFHGVRPLPYAQEMWELYQQNRLFPETILRGRVARSERPAATGDVLALIGEANREHRRRTGGAPSRGPGGPKVEVTVKPHGPGERRANEARGAGPPRPDARGERRANEARGAGPQRPDDRGERRANEARGAGPSPARAQGEARGAPGRREDRDERRANEPRPAPVRQRAPRTGR
ncbi:MAG: phosphotransferase [Myxococcales bacterium]|nr:phosphotransferase [Myxococcales bacterium]